MQLRTNIFLWLFVATVLPLSLLVALATLYSEQRYEDEVDAAMEAALERVVAQLDQRLFFDRASLLALTGVPEVREYLPVLERAARGDIHEDYFETTARLGRLLDSMDGAILSLSSVRVLDVFGEAMLTVRYGRLASGIEPLGTTLPDVDLARRLRELPAGEVSYESVPFADDDVLGRKLLDAVVPLDHGTVRVGYVVAGLDPSGYDRLLDRIPRVHNAPIMVLENDPDDELRHRAQLYGNGVEARFASLTPSEKRLDHEELWAQLGAGSFGAVALPGGRHRIYFSEYHPYPKRLGSWIVAMRLDLDAIASPFRRILLGILVVALLALMLSILLAHHGANRVAKPITALARGMTAFGAGHRTQRLDFQGPTEVRELQQAFNTMAHSLEATEIERDKAREMLTQSAKLASLGQMAAGIGHELNNPLNNIVALVRLMERNPVASGDQEMSSDLKSLREEADRATRIIAGVLNFARQMPPDKVGFAALPWVEEGARLLSNEAHRCRVTLETEVEADMVLFGDRGQLQQVLINLGLNAIQASPEGASVRMQALYAHDGSEIRVLDRGAGLADVDRTRLFDPFYTTKAEGSGSGLGLSISIGIVDQHDGRLELRDRPEGGTCACIWLPPTAIPSTVSDAEAP
ncbi:MAG: sensor histidine kinase [Gammaproteobacteria bacterium]